jgi:hypothetical protein
MTAHRRIADPVEAIAQRVAAVFALALAAISYVVKIVAEKTAPPATASPLTGDAQAAPER